MKISSDKIKTRLKSTPEILNKSFFINSAVLIPLIRIENKDYFLFEVRGKNIKQPGEVCFPGGKIDEQDKSNKVTAIRETCEELGITVDKINYIAKLGTFINVTGFSIDAHIGKLIIKDLSELNINKNEVESIFIIPVDYFINHEPEKYKMHMEVSPFITENGNKKTTFPVEELNLPSEYQAKRDGIFYPVYVYRTESGIIWGITAFLIKVFIDILR
jgi:8-oxo-dGTP pyrophosphatase MutT (NUDIX family)